MSARRVARSRTPSPVTTSPAEGTEEKAQGKQEAVRPKEPSVRRKPSVVAIIEEDEEDGAKDEGKRQRVPHKRMSMGFNEEERKAMGWG